MLIVAVACDTHFPRGRDVSVTTVRTCGSAVKVVDGRDVGVVEPGKVQGILAEVATGLFIRPNVVGKNFDGHFPI